jgi:hypothetical protein
MSTSLTTKEREETVNITKDYLFMLLLDSAELKYIKNKLDIDDKEFIEHEDIIMQCALDLIHNDKHDYVTHVHRLNKMLVDNDM